MKTTRNLILILPLILLSACASPEADDTAKNSNAQPAAELKRPAETTPAVSSAPASTELSKQSPQFSAGAPAAIPTPSSPTQPLPANMLPRMVVPVKKIDFGKQPKGKSLNRSIVVKNTGKAELKIDSVQPSCGCTTVEFPKVIAPGKSGAIKIKVDTGQSPGPHTKSVTIKSNDPAEPVVQVELAFTVK